MPVFNFFPELDNVETPLQNKEATTAFDTLRGLGDTSVNPVPPPQEVSDIMKANLASESVQQRGGTDIFEDLSKDSNEAQQKALTRFQELNQARFETESGRDPIEISEARITLAEEQLKIARESGGRLDIAYADKVYNDALDAHVQLVADIEKTRRTNQTNIAKEALGGANDIDVEAMRQENANARTKFDAKSKEELEIMKRDWAVEDRDLARENKLTDDETAYERLIAITDRKADQQIERQRLIHEQNLAVLAAGGELDTKAKAQAEARYNDYVSDVVSIDMDTLSSFGSGDIGVASNTGYNLTRKALSEGLKFLGLVNWQEETPTSEGGNTMKQIFTHFPVIMTRLTSGQRNTNALLDIYKNLVDPAGLNTEAALVNKLEYIFDTYSAARDNAINNLEHAGQVENLTANLSGGVKLSGVEMVRTGLALHNYYVENGLDDKASKMYEKLEAIQGFDLDEFLAGESEDADK